ncbi:hypothetical protein I4U23_003822 [Adineta vaga]|nr:hypothetical protein I4U23_003822 [Adineta vaga]
MDFDKIRQLTADDENTFQSYKLGIEKALHKTFPSLSTDFQAKAVGVNVVDACALLYTYMIALPDGKFAKVKFTVGGLPAPGTPINREPTFTVDSESYSTIDS